MIIDKDPFLKIYHCGNRPGDETENLNKIIEEGRLNEVCTPLLNKPKTNGPYPLPEQPNLFQKIMHFFRNLF